MTLLTNSGARKRFRRPETVLRQLRHVLEALVRSEQAGDVVRARAEVVDRERVTERGLHVVAVRLEVEARAVQLAVRVVLVGGERGPAVLVEVKHGLASDVA